MSGKRSSDTLIQSEKDLVDQHLAHACDGLRHQKFGHDK